MDRSFASNESYFKGDNMDEKIDGVGQFFSLSMAMVYDIVSQGGQANEVIVAAVLQRGAGKFSKTFWAENAVIKNVGMNSGETRKAFEWLLARNFITNVSTIAAGKKTTDEQTDSAEVSENAPNMEKSKKTNTQWSVLGSKGAVIYLPNSLVDRGVKQYGPLGKLFNQYRIKPSVGITVREARLDLIMLLLHLYNAHDIGRYGGVSPLAWHHKWIPVQEGTGAGNSSSVTQLVGSDAEIYEIERGEQHLSEEFEATALSHIKNDGDRRERGRHAMTVLNELDFFYEVLNIWTGNPLDEDEAQLAYPLYIFEKRARDKDEPYLAKKINALAFDVYSDLAGETLFSRDGKLEASRNDNFRYLGYRLLKCFPLSVKRMRYRAHCRDNGIGFAAQSKAVEDWSEEIDQLLQAFAECDLE